MLNLVDSLFDLSKTIASKYFEKNSEIWEVFSNIDKIIFDLIKTLPKNEFYEISENAWVSNSSKIDNNVSIKGPLIVDQEAQVRFGAFIRGNVIIGKKAVIGNSTELKNCILFDEVQVPHFNYVGDSILGYKVHLGASAVVSNVRSDKKNIKIKFDNQVIDTNLCKFGALIGDITEIGCGAIINPGSIIGKMCTIYPLSMVRGNLTEMTIHKNNGEKVRKM